MFIGEFEHNIDDKGRLIMPAKFREELGNEFVVTKGLDGCLFVYTLKEWSNIEEKMHEKPMTTREARKFMRFFFAGAANCEVDKQGRILLPQNLRDHAGLTKEVVLAGVSSRIEIWSKDKWNDSNAYSEDEMDEIAENMADLGIFI
ncbi:MAG: division/cell wall cluster transcriptional repressor MraZ [Lachnospiraceae bacterium]|nr:division/cell wall cluster transcriptional repressor MraZ [Lachnospiraceae bacterium]